MVGVDLVEGVVAAFDAARGLGQLELADGRRVGFHATQLADGSRSIAPGTRVVAELVAWHAGQLEAARIRAVESSVTPGPGTPRT